MILGLLPKELDVFLAFIKASRSELAHPMYLPIILCEMQTDSDSDNVKRHSLALFQVELQTRMHTYDYATGRGLESSTDLDYDEVTRKLNGIISRLSFHQMRLETTLEALRYIKQCEKHFRDGGHNSLVASPHTRIDQISDECRALLAEVYSNQRIAQSQLDVVSLTAKTILEQGQVLLTAHRCTTSLSNGTTDPISRWLRPRGTLPRLRKMTVLP